MQPTEQLNSALDGRYAIERQVGEGGMATVYLARDLRHNRPVALKVLKPDLGAVVGVERFLAEIQVTANLQHPNLLPLFDSGAVGGLLFYVMPYVEGESLRARLEREKQLPVDEALHIASAVASALDYAHRHGVIHRDLKPENILLQEGQPLVADFGIALAVSNAGGNRITQTGLSLGTPQYMSPEQAAGDRAIDGRTDIYSLGAVLYEMLTGEAPHTGSTSQAIIARVLTEKPRSVRSSRPAVPSHVEAAVEHALEKLPADRWATAKEFAESIAGSRPVASMSDGRGGSSLRAGRPWDRRSTALLGAVVVLMAALGVNVTRSARAVARMPAVYDVGLPDSAPISFTGGSPWGEGWTALSVSPEGDFAVYVAQRGETTELWYRSLVDTVARPVAGTTGAYFPMLSPDGKKVAYFVGKQLMFSPIGGGTAVAVGEVDRPRGGEWAEDNRIVVSDANGFQLRAFDPVVRSSRVLATRRYVCPMPSVLSTDGLLCSPRIAQFQRLTSTTVDPIDFRIGTRGTDSAGAPLAGSHFRMLDGEHVAFMRFDGTLSVASVDLKTQKAGRPVPMVGGVRREGFDAPGQYAVSASGLLVYVTGENAEVGRYATLRDAAGPMELTLPPAAYHRFDVTRDGRRLASVQIVVDGTMELWVYDVARGQGEKWLRGFYIGEPRWDPSGTRIAVVMMGSLGGRLVTVVGAPGSSAELDTLFTPGTSLNAFAFAADSLLLGAMTEGGRTTPARIDLRSRPVKVAPISAAAEFAHALSPDGRWLAYSTGTAGGWDVYLERFPGDGRRYRVSLTGGLEPLWKGPGRLVYRSGSTWYEVTVGGLETPSIGERRIVGSDARFIDTFGRSNVLLPDGSILYVRGTKQTTGSFLRVVPRFAEEVRRRVK